MNKNSANECIPTPAGDPWITCRSKSHHRRIYYYNTITGEAIWNLTDFENERCKKITKVCVDGQDHSDGYPEPKDPPQDICRKNLISEVNEQNIHNTESRRSIFNECIINEPFIEDSLSSSPIDQKWNNIDTLNDFVFGVPVATSPPTSIPNNSFSINEPQIQINIDLDHVEFKNNYVHTTTVPLSERFQRIKHVNSHLWFVMPDQEYKSTVTEVSGINTTIKDELEALSSTYQQSLVANDLRQMLSLKRQTNVPNKIEQQIDTNRPEIYSNSIGTLDIGSFGGHQMDNINQKQFKNTVVGTTEEDNMNSNIQDYIYLVPDANVFQNHICFLRFLRQFSKTFHFIVLENVLKDIQVNRRSDNDNRRRQAQIAMNFISRNIKRGLVSIVQNPIYQNNTRHFYVLNCCLKLVEEHDKIILLSNNKHLKLNKNADKILIFTINEFKLIVNTLGDENLIRNHLYPNETSQDESMQDVSNDQEYDVKDNEIMQQQFQTLTSEIPTKVSIGVETSNPIEEKNTVDASIQTDLDSELLTRILNTESVKTILADSVKLKEMPNNDNKSVSNNWNANLNSPKSHAKDIDNKAKEKNFKWRRKGSSICFKKKDGTQNSFTNLMVQIPEGTGKLNNERNISTNVILPPTGDSSSFGIVSIAPCPNDYWNENNNTKNILLTSVGKESKKDSNNVMFEVKSEAMNENLKSHSDEWVSRFVQIMEEALTQVLEKNPSQSPNVLAPPWTLFEATTCIKMKYHKDRDIVDAGNKLTNTLAKISDEKGTVNIHPTPKQYMEMYSYGVYLIDTLQAAYEGCEDLQTASESLSKLLNDIQNPNLNTSQNDSFIDVQEENIGNTGNKANRDSKEKAFQTNNEHSSIAKKIQTKLSSVSSPSKCKVSSIFKNEDNKVEERENVNIIEKSENKTSLLSALDSNNYDVCVKESVRSFMDEEPHTPPYDPQTLHEVNTDSSVNVIPTINNSKQPNIIINFTQCADYEEKLKIKKLELNNSDSEESYLDYNNDYSDYENDMENDQYENIKEWPNDKHFGFENIFNDLLLEIRQTFLIVFAFCMMCQKDANISKPERKLLEAKEVYLKISNICNVLSRIIKRDDKLFVSHIAEVLQAEDLMEDFKFDESDLTKYKEIITKYLEQANTLRECLETIVKTYELVY